MSTTLTQPFSTDTHACACGTHRQDSSAHGIIHIFPHTHRDMEERGANFYLNSAKVQHNIAFSSSQMEVALAFLTENVYL